MKLADGCTACPLSKTAKQVVWGQGPLTAPVMFVAEAPGGYEDQYGTPFYHRAKAGIEFNHLLTGIGLDRGGCYITNAVKCHPPNNRDPKQEEIEICTSLWLEKEFERCSPRLIVTLGRVSTRYLLGEVSMETVHGIPHRIERIGAVILPSYHPAYGLHDPQAMLLVQGDFQTIKAVFHGKRSATHTTDEYAGNEVYTEIDDPDVLRELLEFHLPTIAIDTEWNAEGPWCLSFTGLPGAAMVIMATSDEALAVLAEALARPDTTTIIHSAPADLPPLKAMNIRPARFKDTMSMAYLLQDEPQALKPLAFRYCGMKMDTFDEMIAPAGTSKAQAYLTQVASGEWPDPEPVQEWKGDQIRIRQPQNIARKAKGILRDMASKEADTYARWRKIPPAERTEVERSIGEMPRVWLSDIDRGDAIRYSARDADATIRIFPFLWEKITAMGLEETFWRDMRAMPMVVDMMEAGIQADPPKFQELSAYFQSKMEEIRIQILAITGHEINPRSFVQVGDLLFNHLKLPWYKRTATGYSTDDKSLSRLVNIHPVVQPIRDYRSYVTLKDNFADKLPEHVQPNGRIYTTIRQTRVITGRLSSSSPNLMAQPVRTAEGRKIRDAFVAAPDCSLCSCDYDQVEMRVTASESQDEMMMDIYLRGKDIHAETAAMMFGIRDIRDVDPDKHRYPAKRIGFAILNDITAEGLNRELIREGAPASDWPVSRCKEAIKIWFDIYPGVKAYMQNSRTHALRYGYVRDMWGRIRYTPGVRAKSKWIKEEALRQAGNAPIQMGAQGIIKEAMGRLIPYYREIRKEGWVWNPIIQIHDDILSEVGEDILATVIPLKVSVMETAAKLRVPVVVEAKVGKRWGSMEKYYVA